jgi:hypothetical protein
MRHHRRAAFARVERCQHHQPGVVDPAVGILEAAREVCLEHLAGSVAPQVDPARGGQKFAPRQPVVQEQAGPDQQRRALAGVVRHDEAQRPHDVRRAAQQQFAFDQCLAHQAELAMLEIAQAAVNQLARGGRRVRGEVVFFAQHHAQAAAGGVARDAGAVDPAADYQHIAIDSFHRFTHPPLPFATWRLAIVVQKTAGVMRLF